MNTIEFLTIGTFVLVLLEVLFWGGVAIAVMRFLKKKEGDLNG